MAGSKKAGLIKELWWTLTGQYYEKRDNDKETQ